LEEALKYYKEILEREEQNVTEIKQQELASDDAEVISTNE
jgi:transcriptional regulator CtsR